MNTSFCCHDYEGYGCGNPTRFVARHEDEPEASIFVCGKHLAAALTKTEGRYLVVTVPPQKKVRGSP